MRKACFYSPHQAGNEEGWQPVGDVEDVLSKARGGLQAGGEGGRAMTNKTMRMKNRQVQILHALSDPNRSQGEIAEEFGVTRQAVSRILTRARREKEERVKRKAATTFPCGFPGCKEEFGYPNVRGRHESIKHGLKARWRLAQRPDFVEDIGQVKLSAGSPTAQAALGAALDAVFPVGGRNVPLEPAPEPGVIGHLRRALAELEQREGQVSGEIVRLDQLRREADEIKRQKALIAETLEKLTQEAVDDRGMDR
jgi:predicted transcriptional regulator